MTSNDRVSKTFRLENSKINLTFAERDPEGQILGTEESACSPLTGSEDGNICATDTSRTLCSLLCASNSVSLFHITLSLPEAYASSDPLHTEKRRSLNALLYQGHYRPTDQKKNILRDPLHLHPGLPALLSRTRPRTIQEPSKKSMFLGSLHFLPTLLSHWANVQNRTNQAFR